MSVVPVGTAAEDILCGDALVVELDTGMISVAEAGARSDEVAGAVAIDLWEEVATHTTRLAVQGGWLYRYIEDREGSSQPQLVFVPFVIADPWMQPYIAPTRVPASPSDTPWPLPGGGGTGDPWPPAPIITCGDPVSLDDSRSL